jgi:hypothetical protein
MHAAKPQDACILADVDKAELLHSATGLSVSWQLVAGLVCFVSDAGVIQDTLNV